MELESTVRSLLIDHRTDELVHCIRQSDEFNKKIEQLIENISDSLTNVMTWWSGLFWWWAFNIIFSFNRSFSKLTIWSFVRSEAWIYAIMRTVAQNQFRSLLDIHDKIESNYWTDWLLQFESQYPNFIRYSIIMDIVFQKLIESWIDRCLEKDYLLKRKHEIIKDMFEDSDEFKKLVLEWYQDMEKIFKTNKLLFSFESELMNRLVSWVTFLESFLEHWLDLLQSINTAHTERYIKDIYSV